MSTEPSAFFFSSIREDLTVPSNSLAQLQTFGLNAANHEFLWRQALLWGSAHFSPAVPTPPASNLVLSAMRVLLRHRGTKLHIGAKPEDWVEREQAQDYKHVASAIQAAQQHLSKSALEVLIAFEDPRYDISLPLQP